MADNTCGNCGKSEKDQYLVINGNDMWCLDCMRLNGLCISCATDIRPLVKDYFNYEEDRCPKCIELENQTK